MRILIWHVHGAWATAFVQGGHEYLVPVDAQSGPDGRGLGIGLSIVAAAADTMEIRGGEELVITFALRR